MSNALMRPYVRDEATGIWSRPGYSGIPYNDGDEIEQRLFAIINSVQDRSVLSAELRAYCTDWPSTYHLSSARANILRPFESSLRGKVLEIGAGCGAITRYLGECGAQVLALEGTLRRAAIAKARTRDLENVTVLAESFSTFESEEKFDTITLIGVLEYASMFVDAEQPDVAMLQKVRQLLKPTGRLIIAIENQLGLKYFAGALEDHVGIPSFGIENRYKPKGVRTYGRAAISLLLKNAGFQSLQFLAPFPDYKFPASIVNESGFNCEAFDASALAIQSVRKDPQLPATLSFQPERAWQPIFENEIALDLSNSFLISAHTLNVDAEEKGEEERTLAWHFSTSRRPEFCKVTRFMESSPSQIVVGCTRPLTNARDNESRGYLSNRIDSKLPYIKGSTLSSELLDTVTRDGWSNREIAAFIHRYFLALSELTGTTIDFDGLFDEDLSGKFIDAIPQNMVFDEDSNFRLIDSEWVLDRSISPAFLLFRALHTLSLSLTKIGKSSGGEVVTHADFLAECFSSIQIQLDKEQLLRFCLLESELQHLVNIQDFPPDYIFKTLTESPIGKINVWEALRSHQQENHSLIDALQQITANRAPKGCGDSDSAARAAWAHASIRETTNHIQELQAQVHDRDSHIRLLQNSWSWRLTKPLRLASRTVKAASSSRTLENAFSLNERIKQRLVHMATKPKRLYFCIHAYYPEMLPDILERVNSLNIPSRVLITAIAEHLPAIKSTVGSSGLDIDVQVVENRGRDILPFLMTARKAARDELIVKIHTKKSPHRGDGENWRKDILDKLLAPATAEQVFESFRKMEGLGMVVPKGHALSTTKYMGQNAERFHSLFERMPKSRLMRWSGLFSGGSMFFVRPAALSPLLSLGLASADFEPEAQQLDGTMAHVLERLFGASVNAAGYFIATTDSPNTVAGESTSEFHPV